MHEENRPFFKHWFPCGNCGENIEVQEIFFHRAVKHDEDFVEYKQSDGHHICALCSEVVPEAKDWKVTFEHFEDKHGITVIEYDDPNA